MDIQQLRYFSRVYENMNYARAAEELFISRQALRKSVQKLEAEVGQQLFTSTANKLQATQAADRLYQASREALRDFDKLEAEVVQLRNDESEGFISFGQSRGADACLSKYEQGRIIDETNSLNAVNRKLRIIEGTCKEMRTAVLNGTIAYADIVATETGQGLFDFEIAREGRIYIAMRRDDPLAQKGEIDITDLKGRRFSTQGEGFDVHDLIAARAKDAGFLLNIGSVRGGFFDCIRPVEAGLALSYAYHDDLFPKAAPNVVCRPMADPSMRWAFCSIAKMGEGDRRMLRYFAGKEGPFADMSASQAE